MVRREHRQPYSCIPWWHEVLSSLSVCYKFAAESIVILYGINVRRVTNKINHLHDAINMLDHEFNDIAINLALEEWFDTNHSRLPVHWSELWDRHRRGLGLFIRHTTIRRTDLEGNTSHMESLFIEITHPNFANIIVGVIYRPPNIYQIFQWRYWTKLWKNQFWTQNAWAI